MVAPTITVKSVTRYRLGWVDQSVNHSDVVFRYNQDLIQWEARAGGAGLGQGLLVGSGTDASLITLEQVASMAPTLNDWITVFPNLVDTQYGEASFIVDHTELTNGDIDYRIDVYGKNNIGEWTPYE